MAAAERVYQFGDDDFAPLRSLYRTNLPVPPTQFLGRERELAELVALASEDRVRLVTVKRWSLILGSTLPDPEGDA